MHTPDPSKPKVLVAMSGGVDSSVAAALLVRAGYDVVGVFMRLGSPGETLDELTPYDSAGVTCDPAKVKIGHQGCCSINDAGDARLVAAELGVPFYVCNFKKEFNRIIDYFADEYEAGRTPNPCVRCNDWLKFGKLHEYAKQIGASFVASGHYVRVVHDGEPFTPDDVRARTDGSAMLRGVDPGKDQSYVLFGASPGRLTEMMTPIGHLEKPRVRELAHEFGLPVFDKPDSQEICFVPDNDYAGLLERRRPSLENASGEIVDTEGNIVGRHDGQHRFTIGQRRGVGVALGYPIYVVDKDPASNRVVVGDRRALRSTGFIAEEANWLASVPCIDAAQGDWFDALVQVRYNSLPVPARVRLVPTTGSRSHSGRIGAFEARFADAQDAVTPGQAAVVYSPDRDGERVLGGGWISTVNRLRNH